jgi:hypothetical protein
MIGDFHVRREAVKINVRIALRQLPIPKSVPLGISELGRLQELQCLRAVERHERFAGEEANSAAFATAQRLMNTGDCAFR